MSNATLPSLDAPLWSRWLLSLLLPVIAVVIYWEGQDYDPALMQLDIGTPTGVTLPDTLAGLPRFGQFRRFDEQNLYEYINGHAEYYLSAGFRGLTVAEYAEADAQQPALVANLYHMGEPLFAFGVLMDELAPKAAPVDGVGEMAFAADQGLNLVQGPYYLQLTSFAEGVDLPAAARQLMELLRQEPGGESALDLRFPDLGEPVETLFIKEDYRGLDFLGNVLERVFLHQGGEVSAFLINASGDEIGRTEEALLGFLQEEGIDFERREFEGLVYYSVDDPYEGQWFFSSGETRLLGVFAPPTPELLRRFQGDPQ